MRTYQRHRWLLTGLGEMHSAGQTYKYQQVAKLLTKKHTVHYKCAVVHVYHTRGTIFTKLHTATIHQIISFIPLLLREM